MEILKTFLILTLAGFIAGSCSQEIDNNGKSLQKSTIDKEIKDLNSETSSLNETIFKQVEEMPLFDDCTNQECSDEKLVSYLYKNLKYPKDALEAGVEGKVFVQFIIGQDGFLSDIKIARGLANSLDDAAYKVVQDINKLEVAFQPGKQRGQAVKVMYTLPISFKLEGS